MLGACLAGLMLLGGAVAPIFALPPAPPPGLAALTDPGIAFAPTDGDPANRAAQDPPATPAGSPPRTLQVANSGRPLDPASPPAPATVQLASWPDAMPYPDPVGPGPGTAFTPPVRPIPVPEPSGFALLAAAICVLAAVRLGTGRSGLQPRNTRAGPASNR
jgi:hypothetical protein